MSEQHFFLFLITAVVAITEVCNGQCYTSMVTLPPPGSPTHDIECNYHGRRMTPGSSITNTTACETCWCTRIGSIHCCSDRGMIIVSHPPECELVKDGPCKQKAVNKVDGTPCEGPLAAVSR